MRSSRPGPLSRGLGVPAMLGRLFARLGSHRRSVLQTQDSVETNRGPNPRSDGSSPCSGVQRQISVGFYSRSSEKIQFLLPSRITENATEPRWSTFGLPKTTV